MTPELTRMIDVRSLPEGVHVSANAAEREALARRCGIEAVDRLEVEVAFSRQGPAVIAEGAIAADVVQNCAVSGEPFPVTVAEPVRLCFVPASRTPPPADEIEYEGTQFDLGEAIAQTLSLAIDPYATGPDADIVRAEVGLDEPEASGPFAALAALKK